MKKDRESESGAADDSDPSFTVSPKEPPKYLRDPIHDIIKIDCKEVLKVLDTAAVQRLKRIKQLGLANYVYPGADHSRFSHSLGVYHVARCLLKQLHVENEYHGIIVQLSALLHDVGHGPFSHLFEKALKQCGYAHSEKHETWSSRIIRENDELSGVLKSIATETPQDLCDLIANSYKPSYLSAIVSSQFDGDRLDYMLRDSHMTGVQYGRYDFNWLLRNLSMCEVTAKDEDGNDGVVDRIVIDGRRGLSCLEEYLLGNLYLYEHVYYHKTIQSAEGMLINILARAFKTALVESDSQPTLRKIANGKSIVVDEYLQLDDYVIHHLVRSWALDEKIDGVLHDLSKRLLERRLFKVHELEQDKLGFVETERRINAIKELVRESGLDPEYYVIITEPQRVAYKNLFILRQNNKLDQELYFLDNDSQPVSYTEGTHLKNRPISQAIVDAKYRVCYLAVPEEVSENVASVLKG